MANQNIYASRRQTGQRESSPFRSQKSGFHPAFAKQKSEGLLAGILSFIRTAPINPTLFSQTLSGVLLQYGKGNPYGLKPHQTFAVADGLFQTRGLTSDRPRTLTEEERAARREGPFGLRAATPGPKVRVLR